MIKQNHLHVTFIKVKVHAGNRFNELADELAKEGVGNLNLFLDLNLPSNDDFLYFFPYFNNSYIDINFRKFFSSTLKAFGNER